MYPSDFKGTNEELVTHTFNIGFPEKNQQVAKGKYRVYVNGKVTIKKTKLKDIIDCL